MTSPAIVSCPLDALPCAAAVVDSRLHLRATNVRFVQRWTALGGEPALLAGGSLAPLCPPTEQRTIRRALGRRPTAASPARSLTLTTPSAVLALTRIELEEGPAWLATMEDSRHAPEPPLSRLLIELAHDLKTPAQVVLGWVSLLRKKPIDQPRLDEVLRIVERNVRLESDMLNELLEVMQLPAGTPSRHSAGVDLADLVRSTSDALQPLGQDAGVALHVDVQAAPLMVLGHGQDLARIVSNLIANAIKFSDAGGTVECQLSRRDGWAELVVRDQGRGISEDFLPYVFDPFRREQRPDRKAPEGLGIGLAVVRQLVHLHGGLVRAESCGPGRGATFTVRLRERADGRRDDGRSGLPEVTP